MKTEIKERTAPAIEDSKFATDVADGLTASPKYLKSKYFYDKKGDALFQKIMSLPEYYLTSSEQEILENNKGKLLNILNMDDHFNLIDLGAGDALKTKILLKHFVREKLHFTYVPVDISQNAIEKVTKALGKEISGLEIKGISKEYLQAIQSVTDKKRKVILFLGASIGNFNQQETLNFLGDISETMSTEDLLIIGFDLKKDSDVILAAYNDAAGVTKQFNLNLLERINRELGGNFKLDSFEHSPRYDEENGEARSALVSKKIQEVSIPALELIIELKEGEPIHTEISRKYSLENIRSIATNSGFEIVDNLLDSKEYFTNSIWRKW